VHPFSDAGMLAEELPNGRLIEANSLIELRTQPARLTEEIAGFLDEVWAGPRARRAKQPAAQARKRASKAAKAPAKRTAKRARASSG
jgi:hypothetical protein